MVAASAAALISAASKLRPEITGEFMNRLTRSTVALTLLLLASSAVAQPPSTTKTTSSKSVSTQAPIPSASAQKPEPTARELVAQGKTFYRAARFKPALAKFEAALKLEPENDEALGLAAITAFRLDDQAQSRDYFQRRAELPNQKPSVKAYSYYRIALTHWREVHDLVAKFTELKDGHPLAEVPDRNELDVKFGIDNGMDYADRALAISKNFAEGYNIKNLLHAEAALVAPDAAQAEEHRRKAAENLKRAIELDTTLASPSASAAKEAADFSRPTVRIGEFARTKDGDAALNDEMLKLVEGGKPIKRVQPIFPGSKPATKPGSNPNDPSATGVTPEGGAASLGTGRGALTAAYAPGKVKVELLIATTGDVVFAHVIDGRPELAGAAVVAARQWKFEPATFEGKPVQLSGVVTFDLRPR